ncbi:MAG: hypothetical protein ACLFP1_08120 [Candidatus Goldiibacteriota bacterium]
MKKIILIFLAVFIAGRAAASQMRTAAANELPAISVIGDLGLKVSSEDEEGLNNIAVRSVEFAYGGYLLPGLKTDIVFAAHGHDGELEFEVEEANITVISLFDNFGLKAGRILPDIGKLNKIHAHHYPFTDRPLVMDRFLGGHGLIGDGVSINGLLPLPFFFQAEIGAYKIPEAHYHPEEGEEEEHNHDNEFSLADYAYTAKLWAGFAIGADTEFELGISGVSARGPHYTVHKDNVKLAAVDMTIKSYFSAYQRLLFRTESFYLKRDLPSGFMENYGFYSYAGFTLDKYMEIGARYGWSENALPKWSSKHERDSRISGIFTYSFTESTKLRLQYNYFPEQEKHEGYAQFLFGIGPHSHPLE